MRITKHPEERKQEILETALGLFEEKGIQKTSMNDIAETMGVAKGLIYYYFRSKEELVEAVVKSFSEGVEKEIKTLLSMEGLSFHRRLGQVVKVFFLSIQEHPALMNITPKNPGLFELVKTSLSELALRHAKVLLQKGVEEGYLNLQYPDYMLKILIHGIADLYVEGVTDPVVHCTLIEEALGLKRGTLLQEFRFQEGL